MSEPELSAPALADINRLLVIALQGLAEAGRAEDACRLAAKGWSALRGRNEREAERLNAVLHSLTRQFQRVTFEEREELHMGEAIILDVRALVPAERHRKIFETYGGLGVGDKFVLVNDHDPKPLYYQFDVENHDAFSWRYLQEGPEVWRVEIGRTKRSPAGAR